MSAQSEFVVAAVILTVVTLLYYPLGILLFVLLVLWLISLQVRYLQNKRKNGET